jgi:hypothetical protein
MVVRTPSMTASLMRCVCVGSHQQIAGQWRNVGGGQPWTHACIDQIKVRPQPAALRAEITSFIEHHNADPKPFRWTKSADDNLSSIERFCAYNSPAKV